MLETHVGDDHGDVHPSHKPPVPYVSRQCGSLLEEFPKLVGDCSHEMAFASDAMGKAPDAVNLWIGDERSETTFHRDHYENVYCVVRGIKVFHLLPPCDGRLLGYREAPAAKFSRGDSCRGRPPPRRRLVHARVQRRMTRWCPSWSR